MRYFKYAENLDNNLVVKIFQTVQKYKPLAISRYGNNWEDALDEAFFHVLYHYKPEEGILDRYVARVVNTIQRSKYRNEVEADPTQTTELDKVSVEYDNDTNPLHIIISREERGDHSDIVSECVHALIPLYLRDYKFLKDYDNTRGLKKSEYHDILFRYSANVILEALEILKNGYYEDVDYLNKLSKDCNYRAFDNNKYIKKLDKNLEYTGRISNTILCESHGNKVKKYLFETNLKEIIEYVISMFYSDNGVGVREIYDSYIYCSLSGKLSDDKHELYGILSNEIVSKILTVYSNLKVIHYVVGESLILSSSRNEIPFVNLIMFKVPVKIPFNRLNMKRV